MGTLIFQTKGEDSDYVIPLDMRGDGIQARHIPIILKYIADEDQKTRNQGSMKVATIWGFEEPENGVELSRAFSMTKDFMDYSSEIQMFITTHSPAFYTISNTTTSQVIYVSSDEKSYGTRLAIGDSKQAIGETMGLMPLVAPFIAEKEQVIEQSRKMAEQNGFLDIPTVFVEGKTDKSYIELAIELFSPNLHKLIEEERLRIFTKEGEGGCKKLIDSAFAWIYSGNKSKALVLFDCDGAANEARTELINNEIYKKKRSSALIYVKPLEPSEDIISIKKRHVNVPFEIEHLLSTSLWDVLKKKGYVTERNGNEMASAISGELPIDRSIIEIISDMGCDARLVDTIVRYNPRDDKKDKIVSLIKNAKDEKKKEYMAGLKPTIMMLEKLFIEAKINW